MACHKILGAGEQLLEQVDGARVVALPQPKDGFAPYARIFVGASDLNQRGNPDVARLLRKRKDSMLADVAVDVVIIDQVAEILHHGIARRLAQPKHRLIAHVGRYGAVASDLEQVGPHGHGVGEGSREDGLLGGAAGARPCKIEQRSEEHTSELQSLAYLVCRLLLEKKKKNKKDIYKENEQ